MGGEGLNGVSSSLSWPKGPTEWWAFKNLIVWKGDRKAAKDVSFLEIIGRLSDRAV